MYYYHAPLYVWPYSSSQYRSIRPHRLGGQSREHTCMHILYATHGWESQLLHPPLPSNLWQQPLIGKPAMVSQQVNLKPPQCTSLDRPLYYFYEAAWWNGFDVKYNMALAIIHLRHFPSVLVVLCPQNSMLLCILKARAFSIESSSCGTCINASSHRASCGIISVKLCTALCKPSWVVSVSI